MAENESNVAIEAAPKPSSPFVWGVGRRKTAVARVRIRLGDGKLIINKRPCDEYFLIEVDRQAVRSPLQATDTVGRWDIYANVNGGGPTGQAGAVMLGLARALAKADSTLEPALRENGLLTRDSRMKERKKYGQKGARKRFQFSKR